MVVCKSINLMRSRITCIFWEFCLS